MPPQWATATTALVEEGIRKAEDACRTAIGNGCTPDAVLDVVCFYRGKKPAWGPDDLYYRVIDLRPGEDFTQRWRPQAGAVDHPQFSYRAVTAAEFAQLVRDKRFRDGPHRNTDDPRWAFGALRDGTKVECRDFPTPTKVSEP